MTDEAVRLTPTSAKVLEEHVAEEHSVPRKIPATDDIDGQTKAIAGAIASALLTATDQPLHILQPYVADLASQMVAYGVRQTDLYDPDAVHAPAWITDGARQHAMKVPEQVSHTEAEPVVARVAVAPTRPKRIKNSMRAVKQT